MPGGETPLQVAPGVHWARFPMPSSLNHINLWLLEDGEGWTVVDTCLDLPASRELWNKLLADFMGGRPVKQVICTHLHPDHVGLAGWLCKRFDSELLMTREEFLLCRTLVGGVDSATTQSMLGFYRAAGYSPHDIEDHQRHMAGFGGIVHPLPEHYRRVVDGDVLRIGANEWQVVVGSGHSPEHACLHCPSLQLLISGDQILPRISSNVSVLAFEPDANPLRDWLDSCRRLRRVLPADLLVLPAHELPFQGLDVRLTQLIHEHERDLQALWDFLDRPKRVVDCFAVLFKRVIERSHLPLATGEAVAHLNYLIELKKVSRTTDDEGVHWYSRTAS